MSHKHQTMRRHARDGRLIEMALHTRQFITPILTLLIPARRENPTGAPNAKVSPI